MKKIAMLLVLAMVLLSFAACGAETTETLAAASAASAEASAPAEEAAEAPAEAPAEEPAAPAEEEPPAEPSIVEPEEPEFEGTKIETNFFSLVYSDDWAHDPDSDLSNYDTSCYAKFKAPDPDNDWENVYVSVSVKQDDAQYFSKSLFEAGLDAEKAITGDNDYLIRTIGGVDCWQAEIVGGVYFFGYLPEENAYISIYVGETDEWELVDTLLDSIRFNAPAYTGDVTPWYWEGTPYTVNEHNTMVGTFTVNSKLLPIDVVNPSFETFDARIQVVGNDYYIYDNYQLKKYTRDGDSLKFDSDIALPYEPEELAVAEDGTIYISDFMNNLTKIQDGVEISISGDTDYVVVNPSCTWGVSYFSNNEVAMIDLTNGAITNYTLEGVGTISHLFVTDNYIAISCSMDDGNGGNTNGLRIYDTSFNELKTIGKEDTTTDYYGSVSAVTETANGLVVFDGNMRDVYFLDTELNLITAVDMDDLMGTEYPWPCQAVTTADGNVIVLCTDDRADDSCDEAVVFQLTGF